MRAPIATTVRTLPAMVPPAMRSTDRGVLLMIVMRETDRIIHIMTSAEVIDRVAEEAQLEPEAVERVLELTAENLRQAAERHEAVRLAAGTGKPHVLAALMMAFAAAEHEGTIDAQTMATLRAVRNLIAHGRTVDRLIEALLPDQIAVPTPAAVLQARRNAAARNELLQEFGALRSQDVAELAGSRASNRAALANRWRAENRVMAVPLRDELLYPGFQFTDEGKPRPAIGATLAWLRSDPHTTDWQTALWFVTPTGWLGGRRPVDVLDDDPDAVVEAARREVSDIAG
jgi:hypothetical protein